MTSIENNHTWSMNFWHNNDAMYPFGSIILMYDPETLLSLTIGQKKVGKRYNPRAVESEIIFRDGWHQGPV